MKIEGYFPPIFSVYYISCFNNIYPKTKIEWIKSSFLSIEKDLGIITDQIMQNQRLKRLLYYTSRDALNKPNLTTDQSLELFGKNIKLVPKLYVDGSVLNYIIINNYAKVKEVFPNETALKCFFP